MFTYLAIGMALGLSSGLAPGPVLTLVISETLRSGIRAGVKVAMTPLLTDAPIIALTLLLLAQLANFQLILGIISIAGGVFLFMMGLQNIRIKGMELELAEDQSAPLLKGILANVLSPYSYLFWVSVGSPIMTRANQLSLWAVVLFLLGFSFCLVGSKVCLSLLVGRSRTFIQGPVYLYIMRGLGLVLIGLAMLLLYEGLKLFGLAGTAP
ncbi:LysE family translocator [Desulfurispirillum indicum]|uniref:LysE family transporter n=1 Tax=Desulfurispirillum indicum TaxID=936456 RepID=UPI001CFC25AC|nr:LysE family translocator [Desulfurispirillum indicum]UCZ57641.1 LysE family translocator [Desulfurispirillum indicum]